jgi:hypothetical protein
MQQGAYNPSINSSVADFMSAVSEPSEQEVMGKVVRDLLNDGQRLSRRTLCTRLLSQLDRASCKKEQAIYQTLVGYLFVR